MPDKNFNQRIEPIYTSEISVIYTYALMSGINNFFPVLTEMINAKFSNLAQWRLKYSDITQKKEHLLPTQRSQLQR